MTFELDSSQERRLWQWTGSGLLLFFGCTLLTLPVGWVVGWVVALLAMGILWWRYLAWPTDLQACIRFASGHWWVRSRSSERLRRLPAKPLLILPRVIGVPRPSGHGHYWVYQDQLAVDDWRRLRICARFSFTGAADP
ncbi:hypothetical protein NFC81_12125 [Salinispirillum sp. LH 10-3-1]|uniref:Toxin CptA n=1 Tax=Salinispirillum sp. LH 10-3-1 TaxID=2952525 RepID=A0AB38YDK9_9GAMM